MLPTFSQLLPAQRIFTSTGPSLRLNTLPSSVRTLARPLFRFKQLVDDRDAAQRARDATVRDGDHHRLDDLVARGARRERARYVRANRTFEVQRGLDAEEHELARFGVERRLAVKRINVGLERARGF